MNMPTPAPEPPDADLLTLLRSLHDRCVQMEALVQAILDTLDDDDAAPQWPRPGTHEA